MQKLSSKETELSIYVHWPFCKSKCPYCDFNSHVSDSIDHDRFEKAYLKEIDYYHNIFQGRRKIKSIFFGGGTPTLAKPELFSKIINSLANKFQMDENVEITIEANPTSIEWGKFQDFKKAGVNRVSIGVQSFDDRNLQFLGREHSANDAKKAIEIASKAFDKFSFDLMYTLPGQKIDDWRKELDQAMRFSPKHLSLYQLTIEKGTPFYAMHKSNKFEMPDDDLSAKFFEFTNDYMKLKGLPPYEISNYAVKGQECRHNLCYWQYKDFIGIGPGAHGRLCKDGIRSATMKIHSPINWCKKVESDEVGIQQNIEVDDQQAISEYYIMGLRLYKPIKIIERNSLQNLQHLTDIGMLEQNDDTIMVTNKGRLLLNKIIEELLG